MKNFPYLKTIFALFITISILSCKTDDDQAEPSIDLIGTWQRSDTTDQFEYILTFAEDNEGSRIVNESFDDGTALSSARSFIWTITETQLTIDYDGVDVIVTPYVFDADDHLLLSGLTDLHFTKITP